MLPYSEHSVRFRYVIVFVLTLYGFAIPGIAFNSLNFGIICMVKDANGTEACETGGLSYSPSVKSTLLAGYSYGAGATVTVAGLLVDRYGSRSMLLIGCVFGVLGAVFLPVAATHGGWAAVLVMRLCTGVAGGIAWPTMAKTVALWLLEDEKATALGIVMAGQSLGNLILYSAGGYLCCQLGWQSLFYLTAGVVSLTFVVTLVVFSTEPAQSRWVQEAELHRIRSSGEELRLLVDNPRPLSWRRVVSSIPLFAALYCNYVERTAQVFTLMILPTYLRSVLHMGQAAIGLQLGLPTAFQVFGRSIAGYLNDFISVRSRHPTWVAKALNAIAYVACAGVFFGMIHMTPGDHTLLVLYVSIQYLLGSFVTGGYYKAVINMSGRHSGTVFGIMVPASYVASIVLPYIVQGITNNGKSPDEWSYAFVFSAVLCLTATVVFTALGTTERQAWETASTIGSMATAPITRYWPSRAKPRQNTVLLLKERPKGFQKSRKSKKKPTDMPGPSYRIEGL